MITASANYKAEVSKDSRTFRAQFLASGTALSLDIMALRIFKGTGDGTILPGSIYSSYIECTVLNNAAIVADAELTLQIGLVLTRDPETIEWLTIGKYTISDVSRDYYQTEFTAVSTLSAKGGLTYSSNLTFPATTAAIAAEVASKMHATVTIDSSFDTTIPVTLKPDNYTCRGVLSILAGLLGGFVTEDNLGNVVIKPFNSGGTLAQGTGRVTQDPTYSSAAYEVTGVKCIAFEETEETAEISYSYGDPINLTYTNKFMTQDLFNAMYPNVIGLAGYGGEVPLALGDPRLEPGDILSMTDRAGVVRSVPCNTVEIIFDGGVQTVITCVTETETQTSATVKGNITTLVAEAKSTADSAQVTAEAAQTTADAAQTAVDAVAQHFWYDASGAHISEQTQDETQTDYALITSSGMDVYSGGARVAQFGQTVTLGQDQSTYGSIMRVTDGGYDTYYYQNAGAEEYVVGSYRATAGSRGQGDVTLGCAQAWSTMKIHAGGYSVTVGDDGDGGYVSIAAASFRTSGAASIGGSATIGGALRFDGNLIKSTSWTESQTIKNAYGNIYRSAALTKSISSWGFTSAPKVWLQSTGLQCWVQVTSVSATSITYYLVRGSALNSASNVTLDLLCIGTTS